MNSKLYLSRLYERDNITRKLVLGLIWGRTLLLTSIILNIILIMHLKIKSKAKKLFSLLSLFSMSFVSVLCLAQEAGVDTQEPKSAQKLAAVDADKSSSTAEEEGLIHLESTFIGDKEQPSVSYFIPWKGTDSPDDLKWKIERKNDDTLNLVDRDIMLRSMNIYNEMQLEK